MSQTISINPEECRAAIKALKDQVNAVQNTINVVKNSPNIMPSWKGNRSTQYSQFADQQSKKLASEVENLTGILNHVEKSLRDMLAADGVNI
jgi:uncharacterized protein YukE